MRTIERDIVGAFIFSSDKKVLLGNNKKGGVYQDQLVVPGGGIEEGEPKLDALKREILEETGIDISDAVVTEIDKVSVGESEKTLRDTGERVLVKMRFHDFKVQLHDISSQVELKFEDDYEAAKWYTPDDLAGLEMSPATKETLQKLGFI
jgi:8-oxo-dGTP pyrophosphatase MutT (NUDIX family)